MLKSQLIAALQKSIAEHGDGGISEPELIEIAADGNRDVWPIALAALLRERAQVRCLNKVDPSPPSVPPMEGGAAGISRSAAEGDLS